MLYISLYRVCAHSYSRVYVRRIEGHPKIEVADMIEIDVLKSKRREGHLNKKEQ